MILTDADQLREALAIAVQECDEARQQLELEREASAKLREEYGTALRETAERQREACAERMRLAVDVNAEHLCRATPLVTEVDK